MLNEENGRTKFSKKLDDNDVLGGQFLITSEIDLNDYLKSKGLISEVNYSIRDEFNSLDSGHIYEKYNWYEPTKLHYLRSIAPGENFNNNKTTPSYEKELLTDLSENGKVNIKDLKKVLKDGKEVTIGVGRTNLEGSNGLTYQVRGAHAISVVDVTKDDELIVSTWGEQCTLSDLDAINEIRILNIP